MDVKALRYFLAVANEGNLTAAAKSLYLTQSALSRQMTALEEELECSLFIRHSHSLELTQDGVLLRSRAKEIVDMLDNTTAELKGGSSGEVSGVVRIAASESKAVYEVARVADHLHRRHPKVAFSLRTGAQPALDGLLDSGIADFGVFIQPARVTQYDTLRLPGKDTWGVVMRADDPLAERDAVTPRDLRGRTAIVSEQAVNPDLTINEFASWFGRERERVRVGVTTDLTRNALPFVLRRMGVLFTIEGLAECSERTGLAFRPLSPGLSSVSDLAWKRGHALSPAAEAFLDVARELWGTD